MRLSWRGLLALVVILLLGLPAASALGQITDVVSQVGTEYRTPVMGEESHYWGIGTLPQGWMVSQWTWYHRYRSDTCTTDWVTSATGNGGTPHYSFMHQIPGIHEVWLVVAYFNYITMQCEAPTQVIKGFAITPADTVYLVGGLETPALLANPIMMTFRIYAGDRPIGDFAAGLAQERITDQWNLSPPMPTPNPPDWPNFVPDSPIPTFYRMGSYIHDQKSHGVMFPWAGIPVGETYIRYTQHLRLKYTDPCGQEQIIPLGSFRLQRTRIDADHWKYSLQP